MDLDVSLAYAQSQVMEFRTAMCDSKNSIERLDSMFSTLFMVVALASKHGEVPGWDATAIEWPMRRQYMLSQHNLTHKVLLTQKTRSDLCKLNAELNVLCAAINPKYREGFSNAEKVAIETAENCCRLIQGVLIDTESPGWLPGSPDID